MTSSMGGDKDCWKAPVYDFAPLILWSPPRTVDSTTTPRMIADFEGLLERGERHALAYCNAGGTVGLPPRERKAMAEWANSPRVRARSAELCVAAAAVVPSPVVRGVFTAIFWIWTPPMPFVTAPTHAAAIDACLEHIAAANLSTRWTVEGIRDRAVDKLHEIASR